MQISSDRAYSWNMEPSALAPEGGYDVRIEISGSRIIAKTGDGDKIDEGTINSDESDVIDTALATIPVDPLGTGNEGGRVVLGFGNFRLQRPFVIDRPIELCGAGGLGSTFLTTSGAFDCIQIRPTSYWSYHNCHIHDLTLNGNDVGTEGINFETYQTVNPKALFCRFHNLLIRNFTNFGASDYANFGNSWENCVFMRNGSHTETTGGAVVGTNASHWAGCHFWQNRGSGIIIDFGISNQIRNSISEGNEYNGIYIRNIDGALYDTLMTLIDGIYMESNNSTKTSLVYEIKFDDDSAIQYTTLRSIFSYSLNSAYDIKIPEHVPYTTVDTVNLQRGLFVYAPSTTLLGTIYKINTDCLPLRAEQASSARIYTTASDARLMLKNTGYSYGTGDKQLIPHLLWSTPTDASIYIAATGERRGVPSDATNLEITVDEGVLYRWRAVLE